LWACDGSVVKLPDNTDTQTIGTHKNQHLTVASWTENGPFKLLCYFDVLNKIIARLWLKNKRIGEIRLVEPYIQELPKDVLSIYDRNFGAHIIIFLHRHYGSHCLIRMKKGGFHQVRDFLATGLKEALVTETLQERAWRELRKNGLPKPKYHTLTYRLIRVELSTGETEVLLTTLLSTSFSVEDFAFLYGKRWGVETCFDQLKNLFKAPVFSGYSALACKQDLWCVAIMFNLQTVLMLPADPLLKERCKQRKRAYQINRNISLESLKRALTHIFVRGWKSLLDTLSFLIQRFLESLERNVEVETRPRKPKMSRLNERHQTEFNYKAAI
jgi:hypothetical protein